jgi:hypothetical protein
MIEDTNKTKLIAGAAIAALVLGGGGVMLGRTVFAPSAAQPHLPKKASMARKKITVPRASSRWTIPARRRRGL